MKTTDSNNFMSNLFAGTPISTTSQIVFIDSGVADYQALANGVVANTEVVILESNCDGVKQISQVLSQRPYATVHIVSHGSPGCLYLGNSQLSFKTLNNYAQDLKSWFSSSFLVPYSSLFIYGCNVAASNVGERFIAKLNKATGVEIAASTTPIGNVAQGGNWDLEYRTEEITTSIAFTEKIQNSYAGVFAVTTSGNVFVDYNNNGTQQVSNDAEEKGYEGITIIAYDGNDNIVAQTTSDASGNYTLSTPDNTPLRIEFGNLPDGFLGSSIAGANSVADILFIDGTINTTANFGIHRPSDVTTGDSTGIDLITVCYVEGIGSAGASAIVIHNYDDAGEDPYTPLVNYQQIGSVNGLAYHRESSTLFAGSFYKRHTALLGTVDFTNDGNASASSNDASGAAYTSIIYSVDDSGNVSEFARLDDEVDPRGAIDGSTYSWEAENGLSGTDSNTIFDSVGKIGLGDVELLEDAQTLWAVNLNDNKLYELPVGNSENPLTPTAPGAGEIDSYDIVTQIINNGDDLGVNPQENIRPFALSNRNGLVYIGMVNTSQYDAAGVEGNLTAADLRAFVYTFDPNNPASAPTQVLDIPLNYERDQVIREGAASEPANWNPWTSTWPDPTEYYTTGGNPTNEVAYAQPILSDIDFDPDGNMILGFRDRFSDQMGNRVNAPDTATNGTTLYTTDSAGDILKANYDSTVDSWTIETHVTTDGINGNNDPDGEFFRNDFFEQDGVNDSTAVHAETAQGGLTLVPGFTEVVTTAMDPVAAFSGGLEWFNTEDSENGSFAGHAFGDFSGLEIFDGNAAGGLGKANGLGDLEFIAAAATVDIGDRIWFDTDKDGIQDVGESGVPDGVTVEIYNMDDGGSLVTSTTTSGGNYFFSGLAPLTNYEIRLVATDFEPGGLLEGYEPTLFNSGTNNDLDSDAATKGGSGVPVIVLKTGASGENNFSYDIGLTDDPPTHDYGDAPDAAGSTGTGNYQTTASDGGASHIIRDGLTIGNGVTADDGTLQNNAADADTDDGVTFAETLQIGDGSFTANVDVNLATSIFASDDFASGDYTGGSGWANDNTAWNEIGETDSPTGGRIRVNNQLLEFRNSGRSIEREVDLSNATGNATLTFDYSYNNLEVGETVTVTVSNDNNAEPNVTFTIQDTDDGDESEEGTTPNQFESIDIPQALLAGGNTKITFASAGSDEFNDRVYIDNINITAPGSNPATLVGWIDFNQDGEFTANESVSKTVSSSGTEALTWTSFPGIVDGSTYARFRLSTDSQLDPNDIQDSDSIGELSDGEVEDYVVGVGRDYGDAPDTGNSPSTGTGNYQTIQTDSGASHGIIDGLSIGSIVDPDSGLLQNTDADADDTDGSSDEDGVTFDSTLSLNDDSYSVSVDVTNTTGSDAVLSGWIDFNQDGVFDNATERASTIFSTSGTQNLIWDSLPGLVEGTTYARFRLSQDFTTTTETVVTGTSTTTIYSENFDSDPIPTGWTVDPNNTDTATTDASGKWVIADPVGHNRFSDGGAFDQLEANSSPNALVTGSGGGNTDVDDLLTNTNGITTINSPAFTLPSSGFDSLDLSLEYFLATNDNDDNFTIELRRSSDNNLLSTLFNETPPGQQSAFWTTFNSSLTAHAGETAYLRFIATDTNDDSVIEVGVDDINITSSTNITTDVEIPDPLNSTGALESGEVEDYALNVGLDYGDAPDTTSSEAAGDYQTTGDNGGASHVIVDTLKIGSLTDADSSTLQNTDADADDTDGSDDEDGVTFNSNLKNGDTSYSTTVKVTNTTGSDAKLVGWVDFNQNGVFESDEAVVANVPTGNTNVDVTLTWDDDGLTSTGNLVGNGDLPGFGALSAETLATGTTYARFRLTTDSDFDGDNALGAAGDGEVEDYQLTVGLDYGDARDTGVGTATSNYKTTAEDGGASHIIVSGLTIGNTIDADNGTLQNGTATADNGDGIDDEDGISSFTTLQIDDDSYSVSVSVTNTNSAATLIGWIDFDQSGTFDADEAVSQAIAVNDTSATLNWSSLPADITDGITYARFRLSTDFNGITIDDNTSVGTASDGEVEDYLIDIEGIDYGDAPDTIAGAGGEATGEYKTTKADGGASHIIVGGLKLGATVDAETGVLQNTAADADDLDNKGDDDDEDGISFPNTLSISDAGGTYTANIDTLTNDTGSTARVVGWIDFNQNGIFEASEGAVADSDTGTAGTQDFATSIFDIDDTSISWTVPSGVDIVSGVTYARFRISNDLTNLTVNNPDGALTSGEVEDYQITIEGGDDFGDAEGTGTSYDIASTSHSIVTGLNLGSIVDNETSATATTNANATATGDDNDGQSDEDGVTFTSNLKATDNTYSVTVDVVNTTGSPAELIGWIDFDGDGTFDTDEASEVLPIPSSGQVTLNWTGILDGATDTQFGDTYARFRLNDTPANLDTNTPTGTLNGGVGDGGEVEDYLISVVEVDYGDAPDIGSNTGVGNYQTTDADNGASHIINSALTIGSEIDADDGTLQNGTATADNASDTGSTDDEDGVSEFAPLGTNTGSYSVTVAVNNTTGSDATLIGWVDFDGNGSFEAEEAVSATVANNATSAQLDWSGLQLLPDGINAGTTYARFRLSSDFNGITIVDGTSIGSASNGEVEDYQLSIKNGVNGTSGAEEIDTTTTIATTSGNDFIIAGKGEDTLTGGAGIDCFHFNETSDGIDTITDFTPGEDKIDLSAILGDEVTAYTSGDPFAQGYVELVELTLGATTSTIVQIDFDAGDETTSSDLYHKDIAFLEGVALSSLDTSRDFII